MYCLLLMVIRSKPSFRSWLLLCHRSIFKTFSREVQRLVWVRRISFVWFSFTDVEVDYFKLVQCSVLTLFLSIMYLFFFWSSGFRFTTWCHVSRTFGPWLNRSLIYNNGSYFRFFAQRNITDFIYKILSQSYMNTPVELFIRLYREVTTLSDG